MPRKKSTALEDKDGPGNLSAGGDRPVDELRVRRSYTLSLRGEPAHERRLWQTHLALNAGVQVFADWLLTLGGGVSPLGVRPGEHCLTVLSWLTVESGGDVSLPLLDPALVHARCLEVLESRGVPSGELAPWNTSAQSTLGASRRDDAVWVDRAAAFDALCRELALPDLEQARTDARVVWEHLFGDDVFLLSEAAPEEGQYPRDIGSAGAGQLTYHLFSYLFGNAPDGFGKSRHKLYYRAEWARHLAVRLVRACGIDPLPSDGATLDRGGGERSPNSWLRQMFAQAAERVAGHRTKLRRQETERRARHESARELLEQSERAGAGGVFALLDEFRLARARETGALSQYVFSRRALVGWPEVVERWAEQRRDDPAAGVGERRAALPSLQAGAAKGKWGDALLFSVLAGDEYAEVWRDPQTGAARSRLLLEYAALCQARYDVERLRVAAYRHPDAFEHPVFGRFGVSNPQIVFVPGDAEAATPAHVQLVLWGGSRAAYKTPFVASSVRLMSELVEREGDGLRRSRRTRLAAHAARAAHSEAGGSEDCYPSLLAGIFAGEAAGKMLAERRALSVAHEREEHLRWTLSLTVDLAPQGPWTAFLEKHLDLLEPVRSRGRVVPAPVRLSQSCWVGLSFPFRRADLKTGRGGELSDLPGVRVLGVDLRQRFGAACVLWETVTAAEFDRLCRQARAESRRVQVESLWAVVAGAGLFRRVGTDDDAAAWARLVRQVAVNLPGEERDPRPLFERERLAFDALAASLAVAPPGAGAGFCAAGLYLLRAFKLALNEHAREALRLAAGSGGGSAERSADAEWERRDRELAGIVGRINGLLAGGDRGTRSRDRGGLSLRRLEMLEELYARQKSFHSRPRPGEPRGVVVPADFALGLRRKIAALKKVRVRTLAARVVGCALGEGASGQLEFPYAHAVVIEDLRQYRAAGTQTRRENRGLMAWSAASVRDALAESCQLHGLHLREETAAYTSRRSVKTGAPAVRCFQMSVRALRESPFWSREMERAGQRVRRGDARPSERLLASYRARIERGELAAEDLVLVPSESGILVVSLGGGRLSRTHVGMDAAANIGLEALMNPSFPARVWKVAAQWRAGERAYVPASGGKKENPALVGWRVAGSEGGAPAVGRIVNLWRDPSVEDLAAGRWQTTSEYWGEHEARICQAIEAAL